MDASLAGADLTGANLRGVWPSSPVGMEDAILVDANLRDARLLGLYVRRADFSGANLQGARWAPSQAAEAIYSDTRCPDRVNSDRNGGTCEGHWLP